MALPATDNFTAANGTALTTYSANWTLNNGNFAINTNAVYPNSGSTENGAHWNADTFNNDQYSQGDLISEALGRAIGVAVRCHASAATFYGWYNDTAGSYLFKMVAGVWTQLGADQASWAVNDIPRIEAEGTTIRGLVNGSTVITQTDSAIASGSAGLSGYHAASSVRLDNWEGGDLGAAGGNTLVKMMQY